MVWCQFSNNPRPETIWASDAIWRTISQCEIKLNWTLYSFRLVLECYFHTNFSSAISILWHFGQVLRLLGNCSTILKYYFEFKVSQCGTKMLFKQHISYQVWGVLFYKTWRSILLYKQTVEPNLIVPFVSLFVLRDDDVIKWNHFPRYWPFVRGIHRWVPLTKASDAELWCFLWIAPGQTVE